MVANKGSFICCSPGCVAYFKVLSRGHVSAMAIGLASLLQVLFGVTIPEFDPQPSVAKSKQFNEKAVAFHKDFED
ncbi:hypothetical protein MAM1_0220d08259 [Mucor ambiguus]|uniref:Uncharacterized protein n=1 Tax=Mucor ambiguus TaxID=91626 RepID=A0A0C9N2C9_9FUNG|nr:hypothetical protein MAM1_0220d08259 [Mucor ambiguus]